ncbi:sensor histidine kinase [Serinicoccus kebangsaanensis]|uniref:sensor histidine kinase n=1 Tax=Serinicoccus kebangsaanensis TaxID=2602069 RepID=UPI00124D7762|nr:HAMP domain-containing sensor histidine kinase [Serinicoccus kebangsaanensis]
MRPELEAITLAAGTAGAVGLVGAGVTLLVARRSPAAATLLGPVVGVASIAAGVVVTTRAMFLSEHDSALISLVLLAAAPVALAIGVLLFRSVRRLDRRAQQRLADEQRELALARSRQEMVTWASHDLRTPLSAIRVMAEALEDGVAADPDDYHRRLRSEADRMTGMVDDLLEMSRIRSGPGGGEAAHLDLAELTDGVVAGQQPVAEEGGVRVRLDASGPVPVDGVAAQLERVVANVVSNAVRETPSGREVVVAVGERDGLARLTVDDTCGGLRPEDLERVFEPGWRGGTARTAASGTGAGVGLTIARALVEEAGGSIDLRNHGPGCRVTVQLPTAYDPPPGR